MKKMVIILMLVISLNILTANEILDKYNHKVKCNILYKKYNIDINTKSYKGWKRVCNNNKLFLYSNRNFIPYIDQRTICNCFISHYKTRNVEVLKGLR